MTFAVQNAEKHDDVAGQSHGIVDVFDLDGTLRQRFAQHDQLNSPWGVALAPTGFGEPGGALWIGNFGNGPINAFDPESGKFLSKVRDPKGRELLIDGLWTITFGSGNPDGRHALFHRRPERRDGRFVRQPESQLTFKPFNLFGGGNISRRRTR